MSTAPPENIVARVQKLLDVAEAHAREAGRNPEKAEHFQAEAENATALAQRLMTQHAIEAVMLKRGTDQGKPEERRVSIPPTWFSPSCDLLFAVMRANGCDGYYLSPGYRGPGTVVMYGFPEDLSNVEVVYASLLIQLGRLVRNVKSPYYGISDASWRRSWRYGFASGIHSRLARERATIVRETDTDGSLVPMLMDREAQVKACLPGNMTKGRTSKAYGEAARAGHEAAGRVDVGSPAVAGKLALPS